MGTRSLTVFVDSWEDPETKEIQEKEIAVLYRQMDGYPTGHGAELKEFLTGFTIGNGIPLGQKLGKFANGMGCLACQVIGHLKDGKTGGFYLEAAGARDLGEEYIYVLRSKNRTVHLQVFAGCMTAFGMPGTKQENMGLAYDGPISRFYPKKVEKVSKDIRDTAPNDFIETQKKALRPALSFLSVKS